MNKDKLVSLLANIWDRITYIDDTKTDVVESAGGTEDYKCSLEKGYKEEHIVYV